MPWVVLSMFIFPVLLCGIHAVLNRRPGADPHVTPFVAGLVASVVFIPCYVAIHWFYLDRSLLNFVAGLIFILLFDICVVFFNWFVFAVSDASMHIRILMTIDQLGAARTSEIRERYNKHTIIAYRLPRLIAVGQLRMDDGRLVINSRSVLVFAAVLRVIRRILGIPIRPELANHSYE